MQPLEPLMDVSSSGRPRMPEELRRLYGGDLWIGEDVVYANFVTSVDGVAAVRSEQRSSAAISGRNPGDRLVMGLLRAWADVVLVGAGTLRAHPGGRWTAERAHPPAADAFAELRREAGLGPSPRFAVLSATGRLDVREPALEDATIITSGAGARSLADGLPGTAEVVALDDATLGPAAAVDVLRSQGHRRILTEGGPNVMGTLVSAGAVDELFLTLSPVLVGRDDSTARPGFVDGVALDPSSAAPASLLSARRLDSYLFLRYRLARA
jgi:riboflavin biosynthesis pyrimidine reductase